MDGTFFGLGIHYLLVFPPVLVRHYQTQVFGMLLIITEFLLPFPLLHIALDDLEALRLFQVHTYGDLLTAYIEFDGFALTNLLFLLGAQFNIIVERFTASRERTEPLAQHQSDPEKGGIADRFQWAERLDCHR